jgi:hypothetical protein
VDDTGGSAVDLVDYPGTSDLRSDTAKTASYALEDQDLEREGMYSALATSLVASSIITGETH